METQTNPNEPPGRTVRVAWLWTAVFLGATALYVGTAQRGVSWQDSGMFQWRVLTGDVTGKLGLALAHPLYIAAGRALATVSADHLPALLNAFSGVGMAVALANLAAVVAILTGRRWIGLLIAAVLAVAHTPWWLATIAEVYTWSIAGLTAELWLLVLLIRRPNWQALAALALVSGLGWSLHNFALLPLPVYLAAMIVLLARRKLPGWSLAVAAAAYVVGAGPYLAMIVPLAARAGVVEAVRSALVGNYGRQVTNLAAVSMHWKANAALTAMNFVSALLPLAVVGWIRFRKRLGGALAAALAAVTLIEIVFYVRYPVPDQFTFLLPSLVLIAVAAGVGLAVLSDAWRAAAVAACLASIVIQPAFYALAPDLARRQMGSRVRERELPFRDELRYWMTPWKHNENSAERFARAALAQAAPNGVILPDSTSEHPLLLVQRLEGLSPRVAVQYEGQPLPPYSRNPGRFRRILGDRRLFAVTSQPGDLPRALSSDATIERAPGNMLYSIDLGGSGPSTRP
ncbi:MAG TPA: hypothetical protein DCX07_00295 [Phycisphaerales bacterium]|nr:hypothetical protein [Phycisphaerales bacterium]